MQILIASLWFAVDEQDPVLYYIALFAGLSIAVMITLWPLLRERLWRNGAGHASSSQFDGSVLVSYFTNGLLLQQVSDGQVGGLQYNLMVTDMPMVRYGGGLSGTLSAAPGSLLIRIELPFHTEAHILGIATQEPEDTTVFMRYIYENKLEQVRLEGDFTDYFVIYASQGQQMQTRYVLDPKAMQFMADNCAHFHWEIVGDELYFASAAGASGQKSNAVILGEAKHFVDQIRPALVSHLPGHALPGRAPYGEHRGTLACPLCQSPLIAEKHWFTCPKQHGRLIGGQQLFAVKKGLVSAGEEHMVAEQRTKPLVCPSCHNEMARTDYVSSGVIIDSCTVCSYRWCDAGELSKIAM